MVKHFENLKMAPIKWIHKMKPDLLPVTSLAGKKLLISLTMKTRLTETNTMTAILFLAGENLIVGEPVVSYIITSVLRTVIDYPNCLLLKIRSMSVFVTLCCFDPNGGVAGPR